MPLLLTMLAVRDPATDAQLLGRFVRDRDEAAFAELVRRHGPLVLGVCRRVIPDRHLADDAFQAAFLVLARKAESVRPADKLAGWLYGVSYRVALRARTMAGRRAKHETLTAMPPETPVPPDPVDEVGAVLDEEIAKLPALHREAVVLCELQGVGRREAAKKLGIREGTLSSRLAKARQLLAVALARRGVTLPAVWAASTTLCPELSAATVRAATGAVAPALVSTLADGVIRTMLLSKLKLPAAALAGLVMLGGLGLGALPPTFAQGPSAKAKPAHDGKPEKGDIPKADFDASNDPLPDGAISRLGTSRLRGRRLAFSPDSRRVVRETAGGDLQLYAVPSGKFLAKIRAADVPERSQIIGSTIAFSPDSKRLAAVLWEGRAGIWDTDTGKLIRWIESGQFYSIVKCDFSPDGKLLAIGGSQHPSDDEKIWVGVYEAANGKQVFAERGSTSQFCDDGKQIVLWNGYGGRERKIRTVSVADPEKRSVFDLNTHVPNSDDPRTDGKSALIELLENGSVQIRDLKTGEVNHTLEGAMRSEKGGVNLRYARGRRELIVTQAEPPSLWCWNIDTGKQLWKRELPAPPYWAELSTDGKTLVTAGKDGEVLTLDALTGKDRAVIAAKSVGHSNSSPKISPDGKVVATFTASPEPGGGTVLFWDSATGKRLTDLPGHAALIHDALFTPDGTKILTAGRDNTLRTWDAASGRELANVSLAAPGQLAQSPDGRRLYASDPKGGVIRVVDPQTGKAEAMFTAFKKALIGFTLTADGGRLIVAGRDADETGTIRVLNAATGEQVREFPAGEHHRIEQMAASADGSTIAAACEGRKLVVWSGEGKVLSEHVGVAKRGPAWPDRPPHYLIGSVAVSSDGRSLAFSDQEAGVALIDGPTQKLLGRAKQKDVYFQNGAARYDVRDLLAVSPDGKTVAWSGIESTTDVQLIELRTQAVRRRLNGDSYPVKRLAFSPDGSKLLSTGPDGAALVWDLFGRHSRKPADPPDAKAVAAWWDDLAVEEGGSADRVMRAMAGRPAEAVKLLREKLPAPVVEPAAIDALIEQLGDRDFATREAATKALSQIAAAEKKLATAAEKSGSAEVRQRAEGVLKKLRRAGGLQAERAVEVLEWIGTPDAKALLKALAGGVPEAPLTRDAAEAANRLK